MYLDLVQSRRAIATRRCHCIQRHAVCWPLMICSIWPHHTIFLFYSYNISSGRLPHRHRSILVRSQNTVCDSDWLLYRSPYYFYVSPRLHSAMRQPPPALRRISLPPLNGIKRFSTFLVFSSLLSVYFTAGCSIDAM